MNAHFELYKGQKLASIIELLSKNGFILDGIYNTSYDKDGCAVQSDLSFKETYYRMLTQSFRAGLLELILLNI